MAELPSASPARKERDLASLMLAPRVLAPPCGMSPACAFLRSPTRRRCRKALQALLTSELVPVSFFTPHRKLVYSDGSSGLGHLNCRESRDPLLESVFPLTSATRLLVTLKHVIK